MVVGFTYYFQFQPLNPKFGFLALFHNLFHKLATQRVQVTDKQNKKLVFFCFPYFLFRQTSEFFSPSLFNSTLTHLCLYSLNNPSTHTLYLYLSFTPTYTFCIQLNAFVKRLDASKVHRILYR